MNIVLAAFSSYVLALSKNSYEKRARKMLMKLTAVQQPNCMLIKTQFLLSKINIKIMCFFVIFDVIVVVVQQIYC
jgi:hypothetical protein